MLKPLEQFICDRCGQVIEKPGDGWVEWLTVKENEFRSYKGKGFKIVHHSPKSPLKSGSRGASCYHYDRYPNRSDNHLEYFLGENGMVLLLSNLDPGEAFTEEESLPLITDVREYIDFMRRLTIPYYEEARKYWADAKNDGYFDGANELWTYLPSNLKTLIETYGDEENEDEE